MAKQVYALYQRSRPFDARADTIKVGEVRTKRLAQTWMNKREGLGYRRTFEKETRK